MSSVTLTAREKEILQLLRTIYPERDKYTLIGGYAVDAYAPLPRYSVDCDLVISKLDFNKFSDIFAKNGFEDKSRIFLDKLAGLETWKFKKTVDHEVVVIELSLDGVKCRQTGATWMQQEIRSTSSERRVVGVNDSVSSNVVSKELLVAMKLHAGRDADLRDVTMLMDSLDWRKVEEFTRRGNIEKAIEQLGLDIEKIENPRFEQHLKAAFSTRDPHDRLVKRASGNITNLRKKLIEAKSH